MSGVCLPPLLVERLQILARQLTAEVGPSTAKRSGDIRCGGEGSCALKDAVSILRVSLPVLVFCSDG